MRNAAVLSNDPIMVESFLAPEKIIGPDGKEYKNLAADLHAISAFKCIDPTWFKDIPEHLIIPRSKEVRPGQKRCSRDDAKTLNFGKIYLCSPQSLAERNNVKLETAKEWDKNFNETFKRYFEWAAEVARIDVNRGFSVNARGRSRWINSSSPA